MREYLGEMIMDDGTPNVSFWLLLLNDYYQYYCDFEDWEEEHGVPYMEVYRDRMEAWVSVFSPFFDHFGVEYCFDVYDAMVDMMNDIKDNGFDKNKHLDIIIQKDELTYKFHLPNVYDLDE